MGRGHHYTTGLQRQMSFSSPKRVGQLAEERKPLDDYIAEREAIEARASAREEADDTSRREQMLEVVKGNPIVVKKPDKRRDAFTKGGKKIKTRTRRTMGRLRLNRAKRSRKIKHK